MERNGNDLNSPSTGGAGSSVPGGSAGSSGLGAAGGAGGAGSGMNTGASSGIGGTGPASGAYGSGSTTADAYGSASAPGGTTGLGASDADTAPAGMGAGAAGTEQSRRDQMKQQAANARERLGQAGERARQAKQSLEQTLADRLEAGANRLRQRGTAGASAGSPAYAADAGSMAGSAPADAQRLDAVQSNVARGMERTADWLRNGDLKSSIEAQARSNPGRTLLVALGVGYLLGKAIRRR